MDCEWPDRSSQSRHCHQLWPVHLPAATALLLPFAVPHSTQHFVTVAGPPHGTLPLIDHLYTTRQQTVIRSTHLCAHLCFSLVGGGILLPYDR